MLINRVMAWGSVLAAILLLGFAVRLIAKNTPVKPVGEARVTPPMQPNFARQAGYTDGEGRAPVSRNVGGIGIVEPAGEAVSIGTQISGLVTEVLVKPGDKVSKGDRLFVLDSRVASANLAVAAANQIAANAKLKELEGQIEPLRSKVAASQALLSQAKADAANSAQQYLRAQKLAASNSLSDEEVETRRLAHELTMARVAEAEARVHEAQATLALLAGEESSPTLEVQRAAIAQAQASVAREQINLEMHTVRAPLDATVLQVKIRVGEFAAAAVLANALMVLGVTEPLHVRVEIDESEISRLDIGARALAAVRGRAEQQVPMDFVRAEPFVVPKRSLSGGVSERVDTRVLQIIYSVSPSVLSAKVGQQVDVFIEQKASQR